MNINQITSIPSQAFFIKSRTTNTETEAPFSEEVKKTQDVSLKEKDTLNIWKELSEKYDITNANFDELNGMSKSLYEAGEISLKEHAILTFDFDRATESLKREIPKVSPDFTMYATQADASGKRNWIEEFQARADRAFGYGNLIGHQTNLNAAGILQKLER
ncbi:hypothetical protein [Oceanobacillus neutriphilus]|uniref:Uncharacterized protein n=1 Tax=Oceanobacillus neutriphilus TaxID=531815 RepID=A0ABQ2P365_9BACI|nr:hypothetical protein [Oceanobacillus neutriphilus]GGP16923.1 hypothetical protein GCM10011346_50820 [Oceanobacillus neutriphilus]